MKKTTKSIRELKGEKKITAVSAYDAITAHLASIADMDLILVGDSVGTTVLGFETTVPVTLDMIAHHTAAVVRSKPDSLVVADLPFGVAGGSFDRLYAACLRLIQESGAEAVKLEGGADLADYVSRLVRAGIPVLGHIGLLPQQIHALGGYRKFGRTQVEKDCLMADAEALQEAGAFAIIGEMINPETTRMIAEKLVIPFIGIGCGLHCDGQILVSTDLLGMTQGFTPTFARRYVDLSSHIEKAFREYVEEVQSGQFPRS